MIDIYFSIYQILNPIFRYSVCPKSSRAILVIFSNRGEVWSLSCDDLDIGVRMHEELKKQFKLLKSSHGADLEYCTGVAFMGMVENVTDSNRSLIKDYDKKITPGRKLFLLSTLPNGSYKLELRDYDNISSKNSARTETRIVIQKEHVYSWSFTGSKIHFRLTESSDVGVVNFLIQCYDEVKTNKIKPFIERGPPREPKAARPLTAEEQKRKDRITKALLARKRNEEFMASSMNSKRVPTRSGNSIEQSRSWKSSSGKSPLVSSVE